MRRLGLELRLEDDAEEAAGAGEIALPQVIAGGAGKGRVEHLMHLRPFGEPGGDGEARLNLALQPHAHAAHAAQRQPAIVRAGILAERQSGRAHALPIGIRLGGDGAEQHVGMTDDIFGQRLDRDVDAVLEGLKEMNAPGIVEQELGACRSRWLPASRRAATVGCSTVEPRWSGGLTKPWTCVPARPRCARRVPNPGLALASSLMLMCSSVSVVQAPAYDLSRASAAGARSDGRAASTDSRPMSC